MPKQVAQLETVTQRNGAFQANGSTASRLLAGGFRSSEMRTLDVLRKDEWIQFDTAVVDVSRERLGAVDQLVSRGLTYGVGNALGTTRVEWERVSDMTPAEINMAGVTEGERDRVVFALDNVPLPIIHKDFNINIRALEASRRLGETLDTTQARVATRLVAESIEDILFNGASLTAIGGTIYGYTTAPNRNTGSLTGANGWITGTDGIDAVNDVIAMQDALRSDNHYGPYGLYVPVQWLGNLSGDFKANSDKTTIARIMELPDMAFVAHSNRLTGTLAGATGDEVILVSLTSDVVDMIMGLQPTVMQWETMGGFIVNFKVMAIMVPRMKSDSNLQSGIAHYTVP